MGVLDWNPVCNSCDSRKTPLTTRGFFVSVTQVHFFFRTALFRSLFCCELLIFVTDVGRGCIASHSLILHLIVKFTPEPLKCGLGKNKRAHFALGEHSSLLYCVELSSHLGGTEHGCLHSGGAHTPTQNAHRSSLWGSVAR